MKCPPTYMKIETNPSMLQTSKWQRTSLLSRWHRCNSNSLCSTHGLPEKAHTNQITPQNCSFNSSQHLLVRKETRSSCLYLVIPGLAVTPSFPNRISVTASLQELCPVHHSYRQDGHHRILLSFSLQTHHNATAPRCAPLQSAMATAALGGWGECRILFPQHPLQELPA